MCRVNPASQREEEEEAQLFANNAIPGPNGIRHRRVSSESFRALGVNRPRVDHKTAGRDDQFISGFKVDYLTSVFFP